MVAAFSALLVAFSLMPDPSPQPVSDLVQRTITPEVPLRSPCVACGIGEQCDPGTGQCVLVERTPTPCVRGSTYDAELGFCVPDETPPPPTPRTTPAPRTPGPTTTPAVDETPRPTRDPEPTPGEPDPEG